MSNEINAGSMADIAFLLLIFFVWTASFQVAERLLPSGLLTSPAGGTGAAVEPEVVDLEMVVVKIEWRDGTPGWVVNDAPQADREQLTATLLTVASIKSDLPVILDPHPQVPLGNVIDVYDITRRAGFGKIQFAADEM